MREESKYKIIAAIIALLIHIGICLLMLWHYLSFETPVEKEPKQLVTDITFGGEYVLLGNLPNPNNNDESATADAANTETQGEETANAGAQGEGAALISTNEESALKTQTKKNGPTKEELEEQRIKREQEQKENEKKKITNSVKNAFGNSGNSTGKSGSANGNATHGALSGQPGHTLGVGYTLSNWGRPSSRVDGEIIIKVRVNAQGKVVEATYLKGTGAAAANQQVRRSCEQASLQSRFSVPKNTIGEKVGTIIWKFE